MIRFIIACVACITIFGYAHTAKADACTDQCIDTFTSTQATCGTTYTNCTEDIGNCDPLSNDYDDCVATENAVCQATLQTCTNNAIASAQACQSRCAQASATLAEESTPQDNTPHTIQSPGFDELLRKGILWANLNPQCKATGRCQVTDILQILVNIMTFIIGITGSVFLLMFIWGGVTWILSGGNPNRLQVGLDTIRDAIIGLLIVFGSYIIVNAVLSLIYSGTLTSNNLDSTLDNITSDQTIEINTQ